MKLSAPIHVLKSQAKRLKTDQSITMVAALDLIAKREGFQSWSLLQFKSEDIYPGRYSEILDFLNPGDLTLIGGRPGVGKTSFSVGLFAQAVREVQARHYLFSLDLTQNDVTQRLAAFGAPMGEEGIRFCLDYSDSISADYIIERTKASVAPGSLIVIDYLQLLDQKRSHPPLQEQVEKMKTYAKEKGCSLIFISQVSRAVEARTEKRARPSDIRLPNPLDLDLFNKMLLLYRDSKRPKELDVSFFRPKEFSFKVAWNSNEDAPVFADL